MTAQGANASDLRQFMRLGCRIRFVIFLWLPFMVVGCVGGSSSNVRTEEFNTKFNGYVHAAAMIPLGITMRELFKLLPSTGPYLVCSNGGRSVLGYDIEDFIHCEVSVDQRDDSYVTKERPKILLMNRQAMKAVACDE